MGKLKIIKLILDGLVRVLKAITFSCRSTCCQCESTCMESDTVSDDVVEIVEEARQHPL